MDRSVIEQEINRYIDEQRHRCLWFLRREHYPQSDPERVQLLTHIQRRGDRTAFVRAGQLKAWLLQNSNDTSADC